MQMKATAANLSCTGITRSFIFFLSLTLQTAIFVEKGYTMEKK